MRVVVRGRRSKEAMEVTNLFFLVCLINLDPKAEYK